MFTLTILAYSASKKSVLAAVSKKIGIFKSDIAIGSIRLDVDEKSVPAVGTQFPLDGITDVSTRQSVAEDGTIFDWLVLK